MSVKGFKFNNTTHKYDYNALDNLPDITPDTTLTQNGKPANSKTVGDQLATKATVSDLSAEVTARTEAISDLKDDLNQLDDAVFYTASHEVYVENLFDRASTDMMLGFGAENFTQATALHGFYVPVSDYQNKYLYIIRNKNGSTFRGAFSSDVPAVDVLLEGRWTPSAGNVDCNYVKVPSNANYLYVGYYNSNNDTTYTREELLEGMAIYEAEPDSRSNLFDLKSAEIGLSAVQDNSHNGVYSSSERNIGVYIPIEYQDEYTTLLVTRANAGVMLSVSFSENIPAAGVAFTGLFRGKQPDDQIIGYPIPVNARYAFIRYYDAQNDILTKEQSLEGMTVSYLRRVSETIIDNKASNIKKLSNSIYSEYSANETYSVGDYAVCDYTLYRCKVAISDPEDFVAEHWEEVDVISSYKQENRLLENRIEICETELFSEGSGEFLNLFNNASGDIMLGISVDSFLQATSLHGFYIPVDPSQKVITISRYNSGQVFRGAFSEDVPVVNGYLISASRWTIGASTSIELAIPVAANYLYIGYWNESTDTLSRDELLAGMTIFYGTAQDHQVKRSVVDSLTYPYGVTYQNAYLTSANELVPSDYSVLTSEVYTNGRFDVCCPAQYKLNICFLPMCEGNDNLVISSPISNAMAFYYHVGKVRFIIRNTDDTALSPQDLDFSQLKFKTNNYSPLAFAHHASTVLDAETSRTDEVYAYLDAVVKTHGNYVTKTLLCRETTGLPIYYYMLGNGAKKVLIVSGQHTPPRDPKDSVITTIKFMHDLISCNFTAGSFLQKLHDECTLLVIPLMNPFGYDHNVGENAEGINLNRDWVDKTTEVVTLASQLIADFDPDIGLDLHSNGTTPLQDKSLGIQVNLDANNSGAYASMHTYYEQYYNVQMDVRANTDEESSGATLRWYITHTLEKLGGLIEMKWFLESSETFHNAQVETINYSMLVNVIKYLICLDNNENYVFEVVPNQKQY